LIIKDIISYLKYKHSDPDVAYRKYDKWIAWLEKQGTTSKLYEEEQNRFTKGVLSNCAMSFIDYLDAHKYEGKMCVSNGECVDIENAFLNDMWDRLHRYYCKYIEKQGEPQDKGEISDGYHTFNELYYYRMLYNAAFFNMLPKEWVHKSKKHNDGKECFGGGWFIVMANLPTGQISNHYELKDWNLFQIPEKEVADKWDGHTPQEAADRLHKYLLEKQNETESDPRYSTLDELIEADNIYQMAINDAMVEEARDKAIDALSKLEISKLLDIEKQGELKLTKRQVWDYCNKISHEWWQITMDKWNTLTDEDKNKYNQFIGFNDFSDMLMNITAGALFQLINTGKLEYEEGSLLLEKPDDTPKSLEVMTVPVKSQGEQESTCPSYNSVHNVKFPFPFKAKVKSNEKIVTILNGQLSMDCKEWIKYQSDVEDGYMVYEPEELVNIEQKPANKVKPKFKVGDYVVGKYISGYISEIRDDCYLLDYQGFSIDKQDKYHLWTIQDAKKGDILQANKCTLIFDSLAKDMDGNTVISSWYHCNTKTFYGMGTCKPDLWVIEGVTPATKEQRELLFSKMKEAGYEWDSEKKELKKIEPKLTEFDKEVAEAYEWAKTTEREDFVNEFAPKFLDLARKEIEKLLNRK